MKSVDVNLTLNQLRESLYEIKTMGIKDNMCIIFDIDNTLINEHNKLIRPVYKIYEIAVIRDINIFIITSRIGTEENIKYTIKQLKDHNIKNYSALYFLKPSRTDVPRMKFKSRKNIYDRGFDCIMSFGDNLHDGDNCQYAGKFIKINLF